MVIQSCSTEYFSVTVCVYLSFSVHEFFDIDWHDWFNNNKWD